MAKMDIKTLLAETRKELQTICDSSDSWLSFLGSAAWNYKYSFQNQVLIYSQRPDATACADFDVWNKKLHRFVVRGSKGIAILNSIGDKVRYVFDVADTKGRNNEELSLWEITSENRTGVLNLLCANYQIDEAPFEELVFEAARKLVLGSAALYLPEGDARDDVAFVDRFNDIALHSVCAVVFKRCGREESFENQAEHFTDVAAVFNSNDKRIALGTAISSISSALLREIERDVYITNQELSELNKNNFNEKEINDNDEHNVSTGRGISGPGHYSEQGVDGGNRENGNVASAASSSQLPDSVYHPADERGVGESSVRDGFDGEEPNRTVDSELVGSQSGAFEAGESDGLDATPELVAADSRGDGEEGIDSPVEDLLFPTVEEQLEMIEDATSGDSFELSQADIDAVLVHGSGFENGKFRIYNYFQDAHSSKERVEFLKKEYGLGGFSVFFDDGSSGFSDHDGKGIKIQKYSTKQEVLLSWSKVQKRLDELVKTERYLNEKELAEYPRHKVDMEMRRARIAIGREFIAVVNDFADYCKENDIVVPEFSPGFLVDYGRTFIGGSWFPDSLSYNGTDIITLMRAFLEQVLSMESPFKERAEELLVALRDDSIKELGFDATGQDEIDEENMVYVPSYKVGDLFFNGASKYTIIDVSDSVVSLSEVGFELNIVDLPVNEFEKIVEEHPANNHLLKVYSVDDYNTLINHATAVVDEVAHSIVPEEDSNVIVVPLHRLGDFYEVHGEIAQRVSEALDLVLTSRTIDGESVPMVGFPFHVLESYTKRASDKGLLLVKPPEQELGAPSEVAETSEPPVVPASTVKRKSLAARGYDALKRLAPSIVNGDYVYLRFEKGGLEPLTIENVGDNLVSIMHSFVQNGDLMRDPDVVVRINNTNQTLEAASYEMSATGTYAEYIDFDSGEVIDLAGQKETNSFLVQWIKNIEQQGYVLVRGETRDGEEHYFDATGNVVSQEDHEGVSERYQVRLYRPYASPDTVKAYVVPASEPLEAGHIVEDERELHESREAALNAAENFGTVFGFDEEFRTEMLSRVPEPILHRYYSTQRPVGPGTYPKTADNEPVNIVNFDEREFQAVIDRAAWGYLEYEHPLSDKQAEDYELVKAPIVVLTDGVSEPSVGEEDRVAVRMQLDENDDSGIFVYIERSSVPCPSSHIELGTFDSEGTALKFCSHIDNLLDNDNEYRQNHLNALRSRTAEALEADVQSLRPVVYCEWSEHADITDDTTYSFAEFNTLVQKLDADVVKLKEEYRARNEYYPYFKTKFVIRFPDGHEYAGRQDIGDGDGSLLAHVQKTSQYNLNKIREDGYNGLYTGEARTAAVHDLERFLSLYLPLLEADVLEDTLAYDEAAFDIGYGFLGNGITVWNRADIDHEADDYRTIAHISSDGVVRFYVDDLPEGVKVEIRDRAITYSSKYFNDVIALSPQEFCVWFTRQIIVEHPHLHDTTRYLPIDAPRFYDALHSEDFVRNTEKPLVEQLADVVEKTTSRASLETRNDIFNKMRSGELSAEAFSEALQEVDVTKVQSADDVFDVLSDKLVDTTAAPVRTEKVFNFKLTDPNLGVGGPKEKFQNNIAALRLLKQLENEGRQANTQEQEVLSKYVGWGGLSQAFDVNNGSWANEYNELLELMTPEEYRSAKASTLSAFYTPPVVIDAIYDGLRNLGFKRGNVLEPSCGVGNFFGKIPDDFAGSKLFGVELDSISGRIAQQLYPEAQIAVKGYEDTNLKDEFFDVAVGNVPFGQFKVNDKEYNRHNFLIHDYFFAKTLDKVRPGGVVAFITSKGTLDKQSSDVRKYIAQRAELVGAIRLPNDTFTANAGTKATSDIVFLKKRERPIEEEPDWVHLGHTEDGLPINSYFVEHPEMVLGHMEMDRMQYGREDTTCAPIPGASLSEQLRVAVNNIQGVMANRNMGFDAALDDVSGDDIVTSIPADPDVRNFSFTVVDGEIYYRLDNEMIKQDLNPTRERRVRGLMEIRDCLRRLIDLQRFDHSDAEIEAEQSKLNRLYDEFTAKYGLINSRGNSMAFGDDNSYYLLCSLENVDEKGELLSKADMFTKRTIKRHVPVVSVGTASEALSVSISEKARVDLDYMYRLSDITPEQLVNDLQGVIYRLPDTDANGEIVYVTADEYLSGNVRQKLKEAQLAAENDHEFDINVMALEQVVPKDLEPQEIDLRLGSIWVPDDIVNQFMWELLDTPSGYGSSEPFVKARYSELNGTWNIENKNRYDYGVKVRSTYGTRRVSAYDIIAETLNLKTVEVYDTVYENGRYVRRLNRNETIVAQEKQEAIKNAFVEWVWRDPERRQRLVRIYNDRFNSIKLREYNGEHLVFEGMNPEITLMPHQKNAIAHAIYGGNTLLAHEVGAGKTFEMVAVAVECKRLGLCSKSMIVVPNHLIGQWASEFYQLYPSANLLVASKKDFEPANRKKFCSRIATGDYDAVIIGHSQLEKIPLSVDLQTKIIQGELDEIEDGIRELQEQDGGSASVKSLEKTRKTLELRLEKLNDIEQDDVITFEELGVDKLFIDEAHYFKNLFLYTKMRNVAGISQTEAKKSSDLYMKTRYLNDLTGAKGVVFATGTPISNSMSEAFTMQRYLQYDTLKDNGLLHFDAWASIFGEVITAVELAPEGTGYRAKTRFAKFHNIPEMMTLFKQVADIKTGDDLDLPKPDAEFHVVQAEPSAIQEQVVESLGERAKAVRDRRVQPNEDNMLKITNDGRLLGLDQRCFDESLPDDPNSKVNQAVDNIFSIWEEYRPDKLAQLVFCDLSTPTGNGFSVYEDVKQKLIQKGVPESEIAFIHDADTEVKKERLFAKVRSGDVRVLMGSTPKMGAGTNVQDKLIALHDLDCPWRPSDLEQRLGRILRQGNQQEKVHVYRYVTKGTFDAYLWQLVENKQKFISQIMTSKSPVRSAEDVDDSALSYAEIKSLCIKDPRIKEKMELDVAVAKLKLVRSNFLSQKYRLEDDIRLTYPSSIKRLEQAIIGYKADIEQAKRTTPASLDNGTFAMVVQGTTYDDPKEANEALKNALRSCVSIDKVELGEYRGFKFVAQYDPFTKSRSLCLKGVLSHDVFLKETAAANFARMDNVLSGLEDKLADCEEKLASTRRDLEAAKVEVLKDFPQEAELNRMIARLDELDAQLRMDNRVGEKEDLSQSEDSPDGHLGKVLADAYARADGCASGYGKDYTMTH